jgi:hypothetical protein
MMVSSLSYEAFARFRGIADEAPADLLLAIAYFDELLTSNAGVGRNTPSVFNFRMQSVN